MSIRPCLAVDSDGAVFDSMTVKHEQAFTPALIAVFGFAGAAAEHARRAFLDLNLRSPQRGCNRFLALAAFWRELPDIPAGGTTTPLPDPARFLAWTESGASLSASSLTREIANHPGDAGLALALAWSSEVNRRVDALPPPTLFPGADEALRAAAEQADVAVVSSAPVATLRAEWGSAGLAGLPVHWGGQEAGSKADQLRAFVSQHNHPARVMMVGDAPGDLTAAQAAGVPFFPIIPGAEAESWRILHADLLPRWLDAGVAESDLLRNRVKTFFHTLGLKVGVTPPLP